VNLSRAVSFSGAAIVPGGTTDGRPKSNMRLHLEAAVAALADAGIGKDDIDGVIAGDEGGFSPRVHIEIAECLGIYPRLACNLPAGGGSALPMAIAAARWALVSGTCTNVLVVAAHTADDPHAARQLPVPREHKHDRFYGAGPRSHAAAVAQRHMYEHGTTAEQLASIAVAARANACRQPSPGLAALTVDEVLASPVVASPLHELEFATEPDGGAALVLTTRERAADAPAPVALLGYGHAAGLYPLFERAQAQVRGRTTLGLTQTVFRHAARDAFTEAGAVPGDMAYAQLHDPSTVMTLLQLEDLGFCAAGEGGTFVTEHGISLDRGLPVNTHGGGLGAGASPHGLGQVVEAVRQTRGTCGERQVSDAPVGVFTTASESVSAVGVGVVGPQEDFE
jgi:acetyl-CoA acetyltransferase